jgi:integrase
MKTCRTLLQVSSADAFPEKATSRTIQNRRFATELYKLLQAGKKARRIFSGVAQISFAQEKVDVKYRAIIEQKGSETKCTKKLLARRVRSAMRRDYSNRSLYTARYERKYVNEAERTALAGVLAKLPESKRLFVLAFFWTGARVSEILSITPESCQVEACVIAVTTLKRREHIVREVPVPESFMRALSRHFKLRTKQRDPKLSSEPLWRFHRVTAWRLIKSAMSRACINGVKASPRGLRHSFGVAALAKGVPLNIVQKLLGHASVKTTTIYTSASGPEERAIVSRFWSN